MRNIIVAGIILGLAAVAVGMGGNDGTRSASGSGRTGYHEPASVVRDSNEYLDQSTQVTIYRLSRDGPPPTPTPTAVPPTPPTEDPTPVATAVPPRTIPDIIDAYPWDDVTAEKVAWCESNDDPGAYNSSSGASGLFQLLPQFHAWRLRPGESLFDPEANVRIAFELEQEQGWAPWLASQSCWW